MSGSKEFTREKGHLKYVLTKLKKARKSIVESLDVINRESLERLKELRDEGGGGYGSRSNDFDILLEQLHQKNSAFNIKDKFQKLDELEFSILEPYFSRIDLYNPKTKKIEEFYIGKFGYSERKPIVTDWRSKVASVYYRYRYPQKNVSYDTPIGTEFRDLKLKRTYEIQDGSLIKFYNNDLQLDEASIISKRIEKRTGGVLEDIIQTIQESQLDIIESDPRQICIVQGCVGSGKSTVAIHKLAHIFFNFSKIIRPERCLMVTKSQILAGYLSTLFPKLGIFDVTYKTIRDVIYNLVFREKLRITLNLDEGQDTSFYNLKKIKEIQSVVDNIQRDYEDRINRIFDDPELESFASFKYSYDETPYENIFGILEDAAEELLNQKHLLKKSPDGAQSWLYKENIAALRKILRKANLIKNEIKNKTLGKVVKDQGVDISKGLNYAEAIIYIYIYSELVGMRNFRKYEYCVVDEAQDFSVLEYLFLDKIVYRGRFALFGDLNQSLEKDGVKSWDDIPEVIKDAKFATNYKLTKNYRSTKQIIDFANKILKPYTKEYLPKSIDRVGEKPVEKVFDNKGDMLSQFIEEITPEIRNPDKSIGIICFNDEFNFIEQVNLMLSDKEKGKYKDKITVLDPSQKISYTPKGVYLMDSKDCKGLEFSKVYIINLNLKKVKNFENARRSFVAVTRAMNTLFVYGVK